MSLNEERKMRVEGFDTGNNTYRVVTYVIINFPYKLIHIDFVWIF